MPEDTREDVPESDVSVVEPRLRLKLEIEEEKLYYKIERRPLFWFFALLTVDIIIFVLALTAIYLFSAWYALVAIASTLGFLVLGVYFFLDEKSNGVEQGFKGIRRIKSLLSTKEDIDKLQIQLRTLEEYQSASRPSKEKYAEEVLKIIQGYTRKANWNRRFYYILQIFIIFCSLLVTGLTSGLTGLVTILGKPWITPAISFAVSFLTAMVTLFRFRERGHNLQLTSDAVQYEISCATKGIYGYKNLSEEEAYIKLAEEVERLINEQRKRQQQLEQASDTKQTTE